MKFKGKMVSPAYYQLYITLQAEEINSYISERWKQVDDYDFVLKQLALVEKNKVEYTPEQIEILKKDFAKLKEQYEKLYKELEELVRDNVVQQLYIEIDNQQMLVIGDMNVAYLGKIEVSKPVSAVASFCFVPEDIQLKFPDFKYKKFLLSEVEKELIINDLLINQGYCQYTAINQAVENCYCQVRISSETNQELNKTFTLYQLAKIVNLSENLTTLKVGQILPGKYNFEDVNVTIEKFKKATAFELTDEIVTKINLDGISTKENFIKEVTSIYEKFINENIVVLGIIKILLKLNEFILDEYVMTHYQTDIEDFKKGIHPASNQYNNVSEFLNAEFIIGIILHCIQMNPRDLLVNARKEYKILELIRGIEIPTIKDFFHYRYPVMLLYNYFESVQIV